MKFRIGTRRSKLALWQSEYVKAILVESGVEVELVLFKTEGDQNQEQALNEIGGKGLFTKALDEGLLAGEIDIAVHSAKDVPTENDPDLEISAFLKREDPRDVLLSLNPEFDLDNQAQSFSIGTSSLRRQAFFRHYAPDFEVKVIRGNVDTRVQKMDAGFCDAIALAYAGVKRLGLTHMIVRKLNVSSFTPAVGQGAIAVMSRKDHSQRSEIRRLLNHVNTEIALRCERAFMRKTEGGCHMPIFGLATVIGETISFEGGIAALDGSHIIREKRDGKIEEAADIGVSTAEMIIKQTRRDSIYGYNH